MDLFFGEIEFGHVCPSCHNLSAFWDKNIHNVFRKYKRAHIFKLKSFKTILANKIWEHAE